MSKSVVDQTAMMRKICLLGCAALVLLYAAKTLLLWDKPIEVRGSVFIVQLIPFLFVLPGMLKGKWSSYAWLTFIVQLYFMTSVLALFKPVSNFLDWGVLLLVAVIFTSALLFVRWTRVAEAAASDVSAATDAGPASS